jgi:hypothetical protein
MNNTHKLIIWKDLNQIEALRRIKKEKDKVSGILLIDFTQASFPLTRDVFFVLSERFHKDDIHIVVADEQDRILARTFWFYVELAWVNAEFQASYGEKNIVTHNLSMWEYFVYEIRRWRSYISFLLFEKLFRKQKIFYAKKTSPHFFLIITGLIVSVTLLLFIFHFAISKTTIYITPQIAVRPVSANIIYSSTSGSIFQWKNVLTLKTLSVPVENEMKFSLSVVDTNSTGNSEWTITIYNELTIDQALKPLTRLVTDNGEVFRIKEWINVPGSRTINGVTEIWTVEANVVADGNDESGRIIGVRWNIKRWTDLIIPGLKFNRDKVYAKAKVDFTGGIDPKLFIVTEDEINKFKSIAREQLYRIARKNLQETLDKNKQAIWEDYALLVGEWITYTGEVIAMTSPYKFWDSANEVSIKWVVQVQALIYDRKATIDYLTKIFEESLLRWTDKFIAIHADTLRVTNIVSHAEDYSRVKATMEMTASTTYDFENATNELTRHMKILIAWLDKKEAVSRLINNWHVKEIEIVFSPFWLHTVSSNIDNIEFVIRK